MNYKDAIHKTVHAYPGGPEALAPRMGYTVGLLRNKVNPNSTTNVLSADDLFSICSITGDFTALHAFNAELGHACHKIEEGAPGDKSVVESIAEILQKSGGVGAAVVKVLEDNRVEAHEIAEVRDAVFKAIRPMMELVECLSGMAEK